MVTGGVWTRAYPAVSVCAMAILLFAYVLKIAAWAGLSERPRDLVMFLFTTLVLPPLCVGLRNLLVGQRSSSAVHRVEVATIWSAVLLLTSVATVPALLALTGHSQASWPWAVDGVIAVLLCVNVFVLAWAAFGTTRSMVFLPSVLSSASVQVVASVSVFGLALLFLFSVDPGWPGFSKILAFFLMPHVSFRSLFFALSIASIAVGAAIALFVLERRLSVVRRSWVRLVLLGATIVLLPLLFFDASLDGDPGHYMAYLAAALHLTHGGVLLVDTFSQYGPGPVVVVYLGSLITGTTFAGMNLTVQSCNLLLFALWIVCLYRMSDYKLPAFVLGLCAIAIMLGHWAYGGGNMYATPSTLALRYLPLFVLVLAISTLRPPCLWSIWLAASLAFASLWSVETLLAGLGIYLAFVALWAIVRHRYMPALIAAAKAVFNCIVAVAAMCAAIRILGGEWPQLTLYLEFFTSQNPVTLYADSKPNWYFFGWIPIALVSLIVIGDALSRAFGNRLLWLSDDQLCFRFVPMVGLLLFQSTYFIGRGIDFTLFIAFLPFAAVAISMLLHSCATVGGSHLGRLVLRLPGLFLIWGLSSAVLFLARSDGPYQLLPFECKRDGICSFGALRQRISQRFDAQPVLERTGLTFADNWYDRAGVVRDAIAAARMYVGRSTKTTMLLGNIAGWDMDVASDVALMYAGLWHKHPRSVTLTDELLPKLIWQIVNNAQMEPGDIVIVRTDKKALGRLEAAIYDDISIRYRLTAMAFQSDDISVWRVDGNRDRYRD